MPYKKMRKGQITLFIIIGIVIIVFFIFMVSTKEKVEEKKTEKATAKTLLAESELQAVKTYFDGCLRSVSDNIFFDKSEIQHIYRLPGYESEFISYKGIDYPVLYDSNCDSEGCGDDFFYYESTEKIEENISKRIAAELKECVDLSIFESVYNIINSSITNRTINLTINAEDIDIRTVNYSIVLAKKDSEGKIGNFKINLPIRLGLVYNGIAMNLLQSLSNYDFYADGPYDLSGNCDNIVPDGCSGKINTISKIDFIPTEAGKKGLIVIEDNRTKQYAGGFNLTFGLSNVDISGRCECDLIT